MGCKFLFVDLQSNINVVNQVATLTLFDPQPHSVTAKSGSGDHGPEGIQAFIDSHCCTAVCHLMQLLPVEDVNETFTRVLEDNQAEEVVQLDMPLELGKFVEDRYLQGDEGLQSPPIIKLA
ncbi:hypothetical protein JB92DRAFT_3105675 [Gautieria morchelliformis]|nr:hypothetical protein JB92DRAFT_3105675 [Gautieria morchelliformis]